MAYEQRAGDISVFMERDKKNPKGPDWKGSYTDDNGVKWEVALWAKGSNGTMLAGSIKPARERQTGGGGSDYQPREETRQRASVGHADPFADDIPFISSDSIL
jgi:hypothetical protein